ncbi:MAG: hypothetical protein AAF481_08735 [Acidobacteriota bacterium]
MPRKKVALLTAMGMLIVLSMSGAVRADDSDEGPTRFMAHKCNLCHGVPAVGIAAKTKSKKLLGPELGGPLPEVDPVALAAYLRQQQELDGKEHKREYKGTDEELQTILDWLTSLDPPAPEE